MTQGFVEPIHPGKSFRWRIKNDSDGVSSSWVIFGSKKHDDVYIATRATEGIMKISFHASGTWNVSLTSEAVSRWGIEAKDRHMLTLREHSEVIPGWTLGAQIFVPNSQLRPSSEPESSKNHDIPSSTTTNSTVIEIYFESNDGIHLVEFPKSFPVCVVEKPSGGLVWVIARSVDLQTDPESEFHNYIQEARSFYEAVQLDHPIVYRDHLLGSQDETGVLVLLELALD